ncbi:MAG TPA: phosphoribosylformylglycinamidine synthase I [Candidatus Nanoarchaeia archaeon]|nr:phosphoribosylformylglycinamidine synthase I [Candidatus Nanoarchaeia archaeon]
MKKPNIAVIYFPGNNCEQEALNAVLASGMDGKIVRWNQRKDIENYHGYVIPGGWAYEDRIRAGVIAAKDPIFKIIKKEAEDGKPVLGVCNGAQSLVECGMIPGLKDKVEMALAPNKNPFISGYYCTWVFIRSEQEKNSCVFTKFTDKNEIITIPIAHGEGKYVTRDKDLLQKLIKNKQIIFRYSTKDGKVEDKFSTNPNGTTYNIAAICNKKGNVMAIMPHPERASFVRQLPDITQIKNNAIGRISEEEKPAPARKMFESMKKYIEEEII